MKCSIVIVNWNTRDLLDACLHSVFAYPPEGEFEVWVVDNHSADDSVRMVRDKYPAAHLISSKENLGFSGGNNIAIHECSGELILLLNPDTEVKPGALPALIQFMDDHPQAGACGSLLLNGDGSLQPSCYPRPTLAREMWRMFYLDTVLPVGSYNMEQWDQTQAREVDVLMGASLMIRSSILRRIGFLDEGFFMYSEEVDICYRIQKAGWQIYWVPQSQVVHYWGQSSKQVKPQMFMQLYRAKLRFFRKHYGRLSAAAYKFILTLAALFRLLLTPLLLFDQEETRAEKRELAGLYRRLLLTLPEM